MRTLTTVLLLMLLMLAGCAAAPQPAAPGEPPERPRPPRPPAVLLDTSYDWHVLLVVPFGTALRDVPLTLHEVLLFRDEAQGAAPADELECYAVDGSRPRFMARQPAEYLLCFRHDRLSRIEATVGLPANDAARIFADACALWVKNADATTAECTGSAGGVAFAGHFENEPDGSAQLGIQLDAANLGDPASDR